jgi:hypothetical protein
MYKLFIVGCPTHDVWYYDHIGEHLPYCGMHENPDRYESIDPADGYTKYVELDDAKKIYFRDDDA